MNQDLLAPPKLTVRTYATIVACVSGLAVVIGVVTAALGMISYGALGWRAGAVAGFGLVMVWGYSRLFRVAARVRPERMPMIHAVVSVMGLIAFYGTFGLMVRGTFIGNAVPGIMWMVPFMLGTTLIAGGVTRRVGESLHCPKCEYEYAYTDPADAPIRCPECGSGWIGLLKKGRRVRSVRMIAAGAVVATLGMVLGNPIFYMGSVAPFLPTPVLCVSVRVSPGSMCGAWEELAKRPLDEKWIRSIGETVIERHGRISYDYGPMGWFEAMMAAGKMPSDLEERFYRGGLRAELDVPRRVKAGEVFTVRLRVKRAAAGSRICMGVMFGGYDIGDGGAPVARCDQTKWAHELDPSFMEAHRDVLPQTLRAEHRGEMRVRATYWLVYQPSFMDELKWQADGTPARPTKASWFEKVELEKVVLVE